MSDNKVRIECPACGCEMVKVFDQENGINIDICLNSCGGIFFDNRELEKFDESHENAETIFSAIEGKTFQKVDKTKTRICPICHVPMVKQGAVGNNNIEIDVCNSCGGKFLDNGELQRVREKAIKDSALLNNMIISLYQKNLEKNSGNHNLESRRKFFQNFMNQFLD